MSVIYILLIISLTVAVVFFIAFIIAIKKGQYEDSYTPSVRVLFEDEVIKPTTKQQLANQKLTKKD